MQGNPKATCDEAETYYDFFFLLLGLMMACGVFWFREGVVFCEFVLFSRGVFQF